MNLKPNASVQLVRHRMQPSGRAGLIVDEKTAPNKIPDVQTMAVLNGGLAVDAFPNPTAEAAHVLPLTFRQNRSDEEPMTHRAYHPFGEGAMSNAIRSYHRKTMMACQP